MNEQPRVNTFKSVKKRSYQIMQSAYDYLSEHGPTRAIVLADEIGCIRTTLGSDKIITFNAYALENKLPCRFRVKSNGGTPVIWSLEERKARA